MDKITVDDQMKKRILTNIKETEFEEHLKSKTPKIFKHNYYRNWGILVACCAIIIYTLNNKYIFDLHEFNRNSIQNEEIVFNESQNSNKTSKVRERIEADLEENKVELENATDTSKSSRLIENESLNNNQLKNDSDNNNFVNSNSSNNERYKVNVEGNNNLDISKASNYRNEKDNEADYNNEQSKNNGIIEEGNNTNINGTKINPVEREITQYSGDMVEEVNDGGKSIRREFKTIDELKKYIDFTIKTPKVKYESNEIKSIIMDLNRNISIEYENEDYSFIFKIKNEIDEKNLNKSQDKSEYEREKVININEKSVLLKGNNNTIEAANWIDGNSSFEIESISDIKEEEIINIIENIE